MERRNLIVMFGFLGAFVLLVAFSIFLGTVDDRERADVEPVEEEEVVEPEQPVVLDPLPPAFTASELTALPKENWIGNGGDVYNRRYSVLDEINTSNVGNLKGKWVTNLGSGLEFKYSGEASPVVYNGVMYVITGSNEVSALDVKNGDILWTYKPTLPDITTVCCGWTSRGVTIGDGMVFVGRLDATIVALDQKTGEELWSTVIDDWKKGYTITSAPLYYDGKLFTGISGGEYGTRGRVTALDAKSGEELWRFYTIPGPGEIGYESWTSDNDAWKRGGAPVWQTPAVDPELGMLYFSTGNAGPDVDGSSREGDNLFASSIVAIDAETGEYKWHFQEVHHDIWDYDAPNPVILFDTEMDGKPVKGLAQAGKTGWVYILDRTNGEPLVGIEEVPVPQDERQKTAATQPFPKGDSFVPQVVTAEEVAKEVPNYKGKIATAMFEPFWDEPLLTKPAAAGGANWPPAAYNPDTGYMYVLATDQYMAFSRMELEEYDEASIEEGKMYIGSLIAPVEDAPRRGTVTAIDVTTNKIAWQQVWEDSAYSGALTTKGGLLFVGHNDGRFIAYDAKTGEQVWEFMTDAGVNAPPVTYEVDGVQYITVFVAGNSLAGSKHGDSVWTFALDGAIESGSVTSSVEEEGGEEEVATANPDEGLKVFEGNCLACHGNEGTAGHNGPDLQLSEMADDTEAVIERIKNGGNTMPAFADILTEEQIQNVAAYITEVVAPKQ
ncbi:PQQ-binding-like beta-propeller repeat protein [Bacillaceae bacterium CLA-AA-H227]|uniref:PQQ-binding-like beta-propeller repeat protein n=1 Tax=Robertmurraya yapensis (ex Hitch et al 2024) TaxID=3133160 RepID=A0ACC6SE81_9BACI